VRIASPSSSLVREHIDRANRLKLLSGCTGFMTSLAADGYGDDMNETLGGVGPDMERYLASRGRSFERVTAHKRERRLRVSGGSG